MKDSGEAATDPYAKIDGFAVKAPMWSRVISMDEARAWPGV